MGINELSHSSRYCNYKGCKVWSCLHQAYQLTWQKGAKWAGVRRAEAATDGQADIGFSVGEQWGEVEMRTREGKPCLGMVGQAHLYSSQMAHLGVQA